MDGIEVEKSLYDISDGDLKDLWGSDSFDSNMGDIGLGSEPDWTNLLDHQPIILHDRMMSDAVQSPRIQSEHSYSLTSVGDEMPDSPLEALHQNIKLEDYGKGDLPWWLSPRRGSFPALDLKIYMDTECFSTMPLGGSSAPDYSVVVKREPSSPPPSRSCSSSPSFGLPPSRNSTISALLASPTTFQQQQQQQSGSGSSASHSLLKPPTILLATRPQQEQRRIVYPKVNIKLESVVSSPGFSLPPTPPSSTGSDSEGSLSPVHGTTSSCLNPSSPPSLLLTGSAKRTGQSSKVSSGGRLSSSSSSSSASSSSSSNASHSSLISSQPKGSTGILMLTEEEKRTLLAEGYPIPQKLPLSKAEERSLKKIRRKIKNKISAQESRRKKKEYVDALEKKVEVLSNENNEYKRRVDSLEGSNKSLLVQLQKLQALLGRDMSDKHSRSTSTQTSLDEDLMDEDSNGYVQTVELMDLVNGDFKVNLGSSVTKRRYRGQLRSNC